jgi:hypothetical protein
MSSSSRPALADESAEKKMLRVSGGDESGELTRAHTG